MPIKKSDPEYLDACSKWLDDLLVEFFRTPTIQDVGLWLVNYPLAPLPPRLIRVLKPWLEEHNKLTIKQARKGSPVSDIRNYLPLVTRMHQDTGLPIEAACKMICEKLNQNTEEPIDALDLRRVYDRSITNYERLLNDTVKSTFSSTPISDMLKAKGRFEENLKKMKNRTQTPE